jgi:hypothetical protein
VPETLLKLKNGDSTLAFQKTSNLERKSVAIIVSGHSLLLI